MVLENLALPDEVRLVRSTPEYTTATVPEGLLRAHRLARSTWGRLRVIRGTVTFVQEASGESRLLEEGDSQTIEPDVPHHVEPGSGVRFVIEFYR